LENLIAEVDISSTWETDREIIKISTNVNLGYYELKKHKPYIDEGFSDYRIKETSQIAVVTGSRRNK
jgi:hypothetical protein